MLRDDSGTVLPLVALCLAVLMGFAGMAVDVGYLQYEENLQQSATDAAAIGASQALVRASCPNQSAAQAGASLDATSNGFTDGGNVSVSVQNPPAIGPYSSHNCAVGVQITTRHVATFFSRLFGYPNGMAETTAAVAEAVANGPGCIYLLSPTSRSIFNGDTVNAPKCGVYINDTATFNGDPVFDAAFIGYAGASPIENGTTFTQATPVPMLPVADPCGEILGCAYLTANPPALSGCKSVVYNGLTNLTLSPGCYNSIIVNGCTNVVLGTGLYIFNGTTIINGETSFTGSGVTLYTTASGTPPTFNGIPTISLSPPASGNDAGVLYYQSPGNTTAPIFNGVSDALSGLIYAPSATGSTFNGTNGGYLIIVVGSATFNGSAAYDFATPPPGQALTKTAVLSE